MNVLKRSIGILLLLAFLSVKYTVLFSQVKEANRTDWSNSTEDPSKETKNNEEENKDKEEETKEAKSPFDELFCDDLRLLNIHLLSQTINAHYLQRSATAHLPSWHLPPEV
jgi:hypothetical protein